MTAIFSMGKRLQLLFHSGYYVWCFCLSITSWLAQAGPFRWIDFLENRATTFCWFIDFFGNCKLTESIPFSLLSPLRMSRLVNLQLAIEKIFVCIKYLRLALLSKLSPRHITIECFEKQAFYSNYFKQQQVRKQWGRHIIDLKVVWKN